MRRLALLLVLLASCRQILGIEDVTVGGGGADGAGGGDGAADDGPVLGDGPPGCRNGTPDPDEECDDGNDDPLDACLPNCRWNTCGDGFARRDVEECDDHNGVDDDGCNNRCIACDATKGVARFSSPDDNHCHWRGATTADVIWATAADTCAGAGAHLVTVVTLTESDRVYSNLGDPTVAFWIGLSDLVSEGSYDWVTGEIFNTTATRWGAGEGVDPTEDCVAMGPTGNWQDYDCPTQVLPYACEDEGWTVRREDGHAYKAIYRNGTFDAAVGDCTDRGGHLATLDSTGEGEFVRTVTRAAVWIGATDQASEGTWVWIAGGATIASNAWIGGEPDGGNVENCAYANTAEPGIRDQPCTATHAWVCEIE